MIMNLENSVNNSTLHSSIKSKLLDSKIIEFTPIQAATLSYFTTRSNFVGLASTGSGKTMAFLLPVITKILHDPSDKVLIIAPTRELAIQIHSVAKTYTADTNINPLLLIGGTSVRLNEKALSLNPTLIIGTPGRIKHHISIIKSFNIKTLIFDQVDQLLSIGFKEEFKKFMQVFEDKNIHKVFFSATLPLGTKKLLFSYLHLETIDLTLKELKPTIQEKHINLSIKEKPYELLNIAQNHSSALIFVNTKSECKNIQKILSSKGYTSRILNGNLSSSERAKAVREFTNLKAQFLIATDVAARGIDFKDLPAVINYDVPVLADSYIHRIGRTGRGSSNGIAYTLISPREEIYIKRVKEFMNNNEIIPQPDRIIKYRRKSRY